MCTVPTLHAYLNDLCDANFILLCCRFEASFVFVALEGIVYFLLNVTLFVVLQRKTETL